MSEKTIDVFISYSSKDQKIADELVKAIEKRGPKCWIASRDIPQGCLWADEIDMAISKAKVFLVVVGENSISSTQVPKEIGLAISACEYIIPYRIDKSELKGAFRYYLSDCQWVDGFGQKSNDVNALAESITAMIGTTNGNAVSNGEVESNASAPSAAMVQMSKKWFVTGICVVASICLLIIGLLIVALGKVGSDSKPNLPDDISTGDLEQEEDLGQTMVVLRAMEDISAYDLMEALEIVRGRLDLYFGEDNYVLESYENNTMIQLLLPNAALTECEMDTLLRGYLIRPIKLYFLPEVEIYDERCNEIYIESGSIEKVELCTGQVPDFDLSEETEKFAGDYEYLKITVSDEIAKKIQALYTPEEEFVLIQDLDFDESYYYEQISVLDDGKTLLLLDLHGSHKINELLKYVLEHETFNKAFDIFQNEPVIWEKDGFVNKQCAYENLEGQLVVGVYGVMEDYTATAGTFSDFQQMLHERIKILDIPYAVGHLANDPMTLVFACNSEEIAEDTFTWLLSEQNTGIRSRDYGCAVGNANNIWKNEKQEDGSYIVKISWKDLTDDYKEKFQALQENAVENDVTLSVDGVTVLIGVLDGEEAVFSRTIYDDVTSEKIGIDEKYLTLLELWQDGFDYTNKNRQIYCMREKKIYMRDLDNYRELAANNTFEYGIRETVYSDKGEQLVKAFTKDLRMSCNAEVYSGCVYMNFQVPQETYEDEIVYQMIDYMHNQNVLQKIAPLANNMYLTLRDGDKAYLRMIFDRREIDYFGTIVWSAEDEVYGEAAVKYVKEHYKEYGEKEGFKAY